MSKIHSKSAITIDKMYYKQQPSTAWPLNTIQTINMERKGWQERDLKESRLEDGKTLNCSWLSLYCSCSSLFYCGSTDRMKRVQDWPLLIRSKTVLIHHLLIFCCKSQNPIKESIFLESRNISKDFILKIDKKEDLNYIDCDFDDDLHTIIY